MPRVIYLITILLASMMLGSCQQELHFPVDDTPVSSVSSGALKKDLNGNCESIIKKGTYREHLVFNDTNSLEVMVTVTSPGSYTVYSDPVNGYSFSDSSSFPGTGTFKVKLKGTGKPVASGTDVIRIHYRESVCELAIAITKDLSQPAAFTLAGDPADCMNVAVSGSFIRNYMDTAGKAEITLLVVRAGPYTITTNKVNGYSFAGSGTLTSTGQQKIFLKVTGKPVNAGSDRFTVTAGTSTCTFNVKVYEPVVVNGIDHFPLSMGSYWVYDHNQYSNDSVTRKVTGTATISGSPYTTVLEQYPNLPGDQLAYMRSGNSFLEFTTVDRYINAFKYRAGNNGDIPLLKEVLTTGQGWLSPEYSGIAEYGQFLAIQYAFFCLEGDGSAVVNGQAFTDVHKIRMYVSLRSEFASLGSSGDIYDLYFARGIGLIYLRKERYGLLSYELKIRRWMVN